MTAQTLPIVTTHLLTAPEVAKILSVSRATAYSLMQTGELPVVRLGKLVRVDPDDLQQFITSRKSYRCDLLFSAKLDKEDRTLITE